MYLQLPISLPKITNFHLSTIILMFDKQKNLLSFIINFFSEVNNLVFQDKTFLMYIKYNLKITNCPLIRVIVMKGCLWHISYNIVLSKTVELEQTRRYHLLPSILWSLYGMVKQLLCMQFSYREGNREIDPNVVWKISLVNWWNIEHLRNFFSFSILLLKDKLITKCI